MLVHGDAEGVLLYLQVVDPQHRLLVSLRLRADFSDGDQFYAKVGQVIDPPERRADRPGREYLEWHLDEVFLTAAGT